MQPQVQDNEANVVPEEKGDGGGEVQDGSGRMSPGRGGGCLMVGQEVCSLPEAFPSFTN